MIIEYTRAATCKDCVFCGYFYPKKKNGEEAKQRRHRCKQTNTVILLSDRVCDKWKMGCGIPSNFNYIKL